jgi:hypothetical protein
MLDSRRSLTLEQFTKRVLEGRHAIPWHLHRHHLTLVLSSCIEPRDLLDYTIKH